MAVGGGGDAGWRVAQNAVVKEKHSWPFLSQVLLSFRADSPKRKSCFLLELLVGWEGQVEVFQHARYC